MTLGKSKDANFRKNSCIEARRPSKETKGVKNMEDFNFAANPEATTCRLIDFDSFEILPAILTDTYLLVARGIKPCLNMDVRLVARTYIRCPEYWGIEVVGCLSGICLTATAPYAEVISLDGKTGSKGIELIGANNREIIEVAGGCSG